MSIDLDWAQLDEELCSRTLHVINEALKTCKKPNFLGDIRATSFSMGRVSPQLEIVEIRDVFEEFLHVEHEDEEDHIDDDLVDDDEEEEDNQAMEYVGSNSNTGGLLSPTMSHSGFSATGGSSIGRPLSTPGLYTPSAGLWMHRNSTTTTNTKTSSISTSAHGYPFPRVGSAHVHSGGHAHPLSPTHEEGNDEAGSYTGSMYTEGLKKTAIHHRNILVNDPIHPHPHPPPLTAESQSAMMPQNGTSSPTSGISLQLHFRVKYLGNMSISLSTTLKVNYPSPSFMSLPLNLRITGLAFEGLLVVAYEGDKKRLHVSVLDEANPDRNKIVNGSNLLKHAFVESEVGQADKLVLKDVAKVEQFVLEMARKALQDEIAWPNFQSFAWT